MTRVSTYLNFQGQTEETRPSGADGAWAPGSVYGQVGPLMRDALDLPRRVAEQLVSKVGQGPHDRDLPPDLRDLLVIGVTAGKAVASLANAVPGQPRLGPRLAVFLVQRDPGRPATGRRHGR